MTDIEKLEELLGQQGCSCEKDGFMVGICRSCRIAHALHDIAQIAYNYLKEFEGKE